MNDLEFAAVTLDKWPPRTVQIHVKGGEILGCLLHNPNAINECQWQNMRYHLGLDKKPHYESVKGEWVKQ